MTNQRISTQIIEAIAETAGVDPLELPPLYEAIDPEALDTLIAGSEANQSASPDIIEFAYADYTVTVYGDQTIEVTDTVSSSAESTGVHVSTGD